MNLIIKKNILLENLNYVSRALSNKNLIPVLAGIKFELKKDGLYLMCSNDDITIENYILKKDIDELNEVGNIIIPGRYFVDIIRKIPNEYIKIKTDGLKIIINTDTGEYNLNGIASTEFPNRKFELNEKPIIVSKTNLKDIIDQTSFAISTQESRPVLTGINLKVENKNLKCIATDSYRLSEKTINLVEKVKEEINIIIPGKNLIELSKMFDDKEENIEIHIFSNNVLFKFNNIIFQSRLLNGTYPDTSKLIVGESILKVIVNKEELYNIIDRAALLTSEKDKNVVKMEVIKNKIIVSSISQEIGKIEETMNINKDNNKEMSIAFSSKYMMDAIRAFKKENIEINLSGEIKPIIIKSENEEDLIQLILPIKTF